MHSTKSVKMLTDDLSSLRGKDVLIVEDIIDTGFTLNELIKYVAQFEPKTIRIATLTLKRGVESANQPHVDFVGFSVPNKFILGFGLDVNEDFRDIPHVVTMSNEGKKWLGL